MLPFRVTPVRLNLCATLMFALGVVTCATSSAKVTCIRIVSEHTADTTDLKRFRQFRQWQDKTGNDLALAICSS
jgi:hypothetical protein